MISRLLLAALLSGAVPAVAAVVVKPGQSIQSAIDAASPGTTIVVQPGTYQEPGWPHAVTVTKDGIRLIGHPRPGKPVVIQQTGEQENGLWVSPADSLAPDDAELPPCGPNGTMVRRFTVQGITVRGFHGYGMYLACVDRFTVRRNTGLENRTYSIFPVRSRRGRVTRNTAFGTFTDACIYVGESDDVLVDHNTATDCQIGLQLENTRHNRMEHNVATGNTAGLIVDVIAGRETLTAADNTVAHNVISDNNRANTGAGSGTADLLPGIGIVINGADTTLVTHNVISGHTAAGMTVTDYCLDPGDGPPCSDPNLPIDPYPDGNRVVRNTFMDNNVNVLFFPSNGRDNCFARNQPDPLDTTVTLPACP